MKLVLEDGTELTGTSCAAQESVAGEVVFNTAMTGYVETLTDPSYRGQILVLTYPLVGNYGVPAPRPDGSLERPFESSRIQVQGLVVQTYVDHHSHLASERSLAQWLASENVPLLSGIDTRHLTQKLREKGTMRGWLLTGNVEEGKRKAREIDMRDEVFRSVAPEKTVVYNEGGTPRILLVDAGCKDNICRSLLERGACVVRAPYHADIVGLAKDCDGVLLGNGPGDPKNLGELIGKVKVLVDSYDKPLFGVCLGNQILALAAGGNTAKMRYGHRSVNQPVQDLLTRHSYITSQNHGYAVQSESLPDGWEPWFVNLNDGTNEGIRCRHKPFNSVQFHPEASPGPRDTGFLFDEFLRQVGRR
ncbi:MAG: glutamine-hydrolyzing carbamoyl-phosphate synthase small subunit [Myxococcales bacterium]|nr:glutamine-hydrolyzing carbamoyl-phosphate synthase small subunit [Myxococcales bacterium]